MHAKIKKVVQECIENINETLSNKIDLSNLDHVEIYGPNGVIDSIALISLIVDIEYQIEEKFNHSLILANEKSMSQKNSPFSNLNALTSYIEILLKEEKNEK
jgi:hypothetical protein